MTIQMIDSIRVMTVDEARQATDAIKSGLVELRQLFLEVYERDGWKALGYSNFIEYAKTEFDYSKSHAYRLIDVGEVERNLQNSPTGENRQIPERQLRPLVALPADVQPIAWSEATATAPNGKVTAAHVETVARRYIAPVAPPEPDEPEELEDTRGWVWTYDPESGPAWCKYCYESHQDWEQGVDYPEPAWICLRCDHAMVDKFLEPGNPYEDESDDEPQPDPVPPAKPHVSHNSGNNEWYTPAEYIEAARAVMGSIDLDPATSCKANTVVGAQKIYTAADDGLSQEWQARSVWMNPPYAKGLVDNFAKKLVHHYGDGDVSEAIVLVNNATETAWFCRLISSASAVVFPSSRVNFWQENGKTGDPLQGQAIIYLGDQPHRFKEVFCRFGWGAIL